MTGLKDSSDSSVSDIDSTAVCWASLIGLVGCRDDLSGLLIGTSAMV